MGVFPKKNPDKKTKIPNKNLLTTSTTKNLITNNLVIILNKKQHGFSDYVIQIYSFLYLSFHSLMGCTGKQHTIDEHDGIDNDLFSCHLPYNNN